MQKFKRRGYTIIKVQGHCLIYKGNEFMGSCDPPELNARLNEIESED